MVRGSDGAFRTQVDAGEFALDLVLTPTQPVLPQGRGGYSQKGPAAAEASRLLLDFAAESERQHRPKGRARGGHRQAWLDREWSSTGPFAIEPGLARNGLAFPVPHDAAADFQLRDE